MRDPKWLIIVAVIALVAVVAGILNINHDLDTTTRLANALDIDNSDTKINWDKYPTTEINLTTSVELTNPGTYHLTGTLTDGSVTVKVSAESAVKLILDNVSIHNSTGPAIACYSGDDLVIELVGNNALSDGINYSGSYDADVTSVIYSKSDLTFTGEGFLSLTANFADGIVSKDDLTFRGGTYYITATDDAIRGKDSIHVTSGNFDIIATADALKSTNDTDPGKGFILIENGNFNLTAGAKGVKATHTILAKGGNFAITTTDDAIHSDDYINIAGGTFSIAASDDAIHANRALVIDDGHITIAKSYEGLEAQQVTIMGGDIKIAASDDGINAGGGNDSSAMNRPGANPFDSDENCILSINGGNLYINASGDGIDSNGWLYFNGGTTIVDGPINDGNGALDAGLGIIINSGEVIALGSSGMVETPSQTSSVSSVSVFLSQNYPAGTVITIKDQSGTAITSRTSAKSFSHIMIASPTLQLGSTYTIYLNDEKYADLTISGAVTTLGNSRTNGQPPSPNTRR